MNQSEHRLSKYFDILLDRIMVEPFWATAIDHSGAAIGMSEQAQMNWRSRQKVMGIRPSHLDWYLFQYPIYGQLELKIGNNKPRDGQLVTMQKLTERNIPNGCAWTLRQAYDWLVQSGFRLHGNSLNILAEIQARYEAADGKADLIAAGVVKKARRASRKASPRYQWPV